MERSESGVKSIGLGGWLNIKEVRNNWVEFRFLGYYLRQEINENNNQQQ